MTDQTKRTKTPTLAELRRLAKRKGYKPQLFRVSGPSIQLSTGGRCWVG